MPNIDMDQLPLIISALVVLISLAGATFAGLTYRRGKPRIRAKMELANLVPYSDRDRLPLFTTVSLTVANNASVGTWIDDIRFRFKAVVNDACVESEWTTPPSGGFERESLAGYSTFRKTFKVPVMVPKDATGEPSMSAEVTLGTNAIISTRSRRLSESVFQRWLNWPEERARVGSSGS